MKLTKLRFTNLKGLSASLELKPLTILVGSNFAGKSARTDAIRLLLLGHLPELGKLPRATFGLCSGKELVVEGEFANGATLHRRWYLKGDVVKTEVSGSFDALTDLATADLFAVMLDADTYFGLSDRERVNYVFANIPGLGRDFDPESVLENLARELGGTEGLDQDRAADFVARLEGERRDHERRGDGFNGWTPQVLIDFALEFAKLEATGTKTTAATMEQTARGLAYLRTLEVVEVDFAALEASMNSIGKELEGLRNEKARALAAFEQARAHKRRRDSLASELVGSASLVAQRKTVADRVAALQAAFEKIPAVATSAIEALRLEEREAALAVSRHRVDLDQINAALERNAKDLAELGAKTKCPYCGATGDAWKVIKAAEIESAIAGLRTKRAQVEEQIAKVAEHGKALLARLRKANDDSGLKLGKERDLRSEQATLAALEKKLAAVDAKTAELAAVPAEDPEIARWIDATQREINVKTDALAALETRRRAAVGRGHDLKRLAEAEKNRDDARAAELVAKTAQTALRAIQAQMVADAFHPLLDAANSFFRDVLRTPLAYNDGEIGTWREGTWVGHQTFSGAEKRLAYAAIQAALASRAPFRLMILDEMGTIDDLNAMKVARGVASGLERGLIDQFVGIDTARGLLYSAESEMGGEPISLEVVA